MSGEFYKNNETDRCWWVFDNETIGKPAISFDKKHIFYLFRDYPEKLTDEQLSIFNAENPEWADFFKDRLRR